MESQEIVTFTQTPLPDSSGQLSPVPQKKRFLWLIIISALLVIGIGLVAIRHSLNVRNVSTIHTVAFTVPSSVSLIYTLDKQDLSTIDAKSIEKSTFIATPHNDKTKPLRISFPNGGRPAHSDGGDVSLQTSKSGRYIIRSDFFGVDLAEANTPDQYKTVVDFGNEKGSCILSSNEKKFLCLTPSSLFTIDFTGKKLKIALSESELAKISPLVAFSDENNQIYLQKNDDYMTHYMQILTFDDSGKIKSTKNESRYSFITEFSRDFHYAYYAAYNRSKFKYGRTIMQLDQTTGKETVLVDLPNETSPIDLMLSPTEDKLFFIDNAPSQKNYIFYTVTLATKEVQKKEVSIDFLPSPEPNGYVSPDGKYIIFTQYACANCKSSVGSASLFNVNTQTFTPIFTPKAHIVTSGEYTISKNEQDITILGWVAGTPL